MGSSANSAIIPRGRATWTSERIEHQSSGLSLGPIPSQSNVQTQGVILLEKLKWCFKKGFDY